MPVCIMEMEVTSYMLENLLLTVVMLMHRKVMIVFMLKHRRVKIGFMLMHRRVKIVFMHVNHCSQPFRPSIHCSTWRFAHICILLLVDVFCMYSCSGALSVLCVEFNALCLYLFWMPLVQPDFSEAHIFKLI